MKPSTTSSAAAAITLVTLPTEVPYLLCNFSASETDKVVVTARGAFTERAAVTFTLAAPWDTDTRAADSLRLTAPQKSTERRNTRAINAAAAAGEANTDVTWSRNRSYDAVGVVIEALKLRHNKKKFVMLLLLLQSATQQLSQTRTKASHTLPCALLVRSSTLSLLQQQTSADPCASHPSTPLLSTSTAPPEERKKERIRKEARLCSTDRVIPGYMTFPGEFQSGWKVKSIQKIWGTGKNDQQVTPHFTTD